MMSFLNDIFILVCAITIIIVFYKVFTKKIADLRELSKDTEKLAERSKERREEQHRETIETLKEITEILKRMENKI